MLYRDYSRKAGEWVPNIHGGRENLEAIDFLRHLNAVVAERCPGAIVDRRGIDGLARRHRSRCPSCGLGFAYKWNMGWMHDTLRYMEHDPIHRSYHHDDMTFGLVYAFSERFVLPLSHDEVVHGKGSLIGRMPGDRWQKFANLRAYLGFMWTHPGKKLLFMGGEIAQEREWNHDGEVDWFLLDDPDHGGMQRLVRDLNRLYRDEPALHRLDASPEGFRWIIGDDRANSVFAFLRQGEAGDPPVLVVCNMTPVPRPHYRIGVPRAGQWREIANTDSRFYGGSDMGNDGGAATDADSGAWRAAVARADPAAARHHHAACRRLIVPPFPDRLQAGSSYPLGATLRRPRHQLRRLLGQRAPHRSLPVRSGRPARGHAPHAAGMHRRDLARLPARRPRPA